MKLAKKLLDALLYSNIFIGICAVALTLTNELTVEGTVHIDSTCWFIFFSTIFTYSYLKFRNGGEPGITTAHRNWAAENPQLSRNIMLISLIATACFFGMLTKQMQWIVIGLAIITAFYGFVSIPFISPRKKLREFGLIKTLFVGIVWSVTTVALPLADKHVGESMFIFLLLRRFLFVAALTLIALVKLA